MPDIELVPEKLLIQMNEVDDLATARTPFPEQALRIITDVANAYANPALYVKSASGQELIFQANVSTAPGGLDRQLQINDGGIFGGVGLEVDINDDLTTPGNVTLVDGKEIRIGDSQTKFLQILLDHIGLYEDLPDRKSTRLNSSH
jgi:hypothetical protein